MLIIVHWLVYYNFTILQIKLSVLSVFLFYSIFLLYVSCLAETNRSPFDFSEGESELVRGFNTEFRSLAFVLIFLSEYMSILFISAIVSLIFNMRLLCDFFLFFIF